MARIECCIVGLGFQSCATLGIKDIRQANGPHNHRTSPQAAWCQSTFVMGDVRRICIGYCKLAYIKLHNLGEHVNHFCGLLLLL